MNSCELEQFVEIIVDVFPPGVSAHAVLIDSIDPSLVFLPPEIARSVEKRRREFAAGRICAQSALASLGEECVAIGIGSLREPIWPPGFVGSISHSFGLAVAVVAKTQSFVSLGIDVEMANLVASSLNFGNLVGTPVEYALLIPVLGVDHVLPALFSAKEALFKCLAPSVGTYFDFLDVEAVAIEGPTIGMRLKRQLGPHPADVVINVKLAWFAGAVLTCAWLRACEGFVAQGLGHQLIDESQGQLLGQRAHRELLGPSEGRLCAGAKVCHP
ncbi:MAG: 4'-phosphopantetheinyl transferase family protein [Giesbergeria sp.]|jgi:enterobactin synthetase component D